MTPEQQRIAIAEAYGLQVAIQRDFRGMKCPVKHANTSNGALWVEAPDYLNDLNAMHEAEKHISSNLWENYRNWLASLTWAVASKTLRYQGTPEHADAPQRAEAFLKTIGKWKD